MYQEINDLTVYSTIAEIPSFDASISVKALGSDVALLFQHNYFLPGVIIVDDDEIVGVIHRNKFYEKVGRPFGVEIYMCRTIEILMDNISSVPLILPSNTTIIEAAEAALSRSFESFYEPIVVKFPNNHLRILDAYVLLSNQSKILKIMNEQIKKQKEKMEILNQATNNLVSTLELNILLERILTAAITTLPVAEKGAIYLWDDQKQEFYLNASYGLNANDATVLTLPNFFSQKDINSIPNRNKTEDDNLFIEEIKNEHSQLFVPLIEGHKTFGVLFLESNSNKMISDDDLQLLSIFGATAAAAIQNAKLHEEVKKLSIIDPLTGLYNRRGFYQIAEIEVERAKRYQRPLSIVMIDIDRFKSINDKYGHGIGDHVISTIGKICRGSTRSSDICCRFGGEEFIILLPENEINTAQQFAERLCRQVAQTPHSTPLGTINITISLGLAQLSSNQSLDEIIDCADKAMYAAKVLGRNRVMVWDDIKHMASINSSIHIDFSVLEGEDASHALEQVSSTLQQKETEFRLLESAHQISEAKLAAILQGAAEAIISINNNGLIIMFNRAAERIFQYSAWELFGSHIQTILPFYAEKKESSEKLSEDLNYFSKEMFGKRKDGSEIIVEVNVSKIFENGKTITTMILNDVTEKIENQRRIEQAHLALTNAYDDTIKGWARALELRDLETFGHSNRVVDTTMKMSYALGLKNVELDYIRRGSLLHDLGKMGIPDNILLKPGPLSQEEWEIMKQHPIYGYELLYPITFLRPSLDIVLYHHEKWDGTGYPEGLRGNQIPLAARLFAISDVWDALRNKRRYSPAWDDQKALNFILQNAGKHFDPDLVDLFLDVIIKGKSEQR